MEKTTAAIRLASSEGGEQQRAERAPGRVAASRAMALMRSLVSMSVPFSPVTKRRAIALRPRCSATRTARLGHAERVGRLADRGALDRDRGDDAALHRGQAVQRAADVALAERFVPLGLGQRFGESPSMSTSTCACRGGGRRRSACSGRWRRPTASPPRPAARYDASDGSPAVPPARHPPARRRHGRCAGGSNHGRTLRATPSEKDGVGAFVACHGRPEKPGECGVVRPRQAWLPPLRPQPRRFCYVGRWQKYPRTPAVSRHHETVFDGPAVTILGRRTGEVDGMGRRTRSLPILHQENMP
jgi:hypothetical protein